MTKGNTSSASKRPALICALELPAFFLLLLNPLLHADPSRPTLPPEDRTNGKHTLAAIENLKPHTVGCAARVESLLGRTIGTATIVGNDGYVLMKASEVPDLEKTRIKFSDGRKADLREVHREPRLDLVLAQAVGITGLHPASLEAAARTLPLGQWLCSVAHAGTETRLGIVSARTRRIRGEGAAMGIRMEEKPAKAGKGVRIVGVASDSPAEAAGLKEGDVLLSIAGENASDFQRVHDIIKQRQPGETLELRIQREKQEETCRVRLASRTKVLDNWNGEDFANGGVSLRNDNFPEVLQHDIPLLPTDMGGPVATLEGKIVGINIARVDRVTTFALPVEVFWPETQQWIHADRHPPKAVLAK
ncbi:S1C family serine protease [Prosthecobacter vanneervenii]|uniref:S1-C subfamily serine protease n=1 Tax=Prosthecobacter vanneervenii TaxID=48466 RepID=A0A7W7YAM5_9BACT|nr:PDZ domain-containing protein [Prosthecobacter vanneervenii]MBB5032693.1 S1-C subfamily serine protease [Prosthecobacter vanneervenii]